MSSTLTTTIYHLQRNALYEKEKPYQLNYDPEENQQKTNMIMHKVDDIVIEDIRGREADFNFEKNSFILVNLDTEMEPVDFEEKRKIEMNYLPKVAHLVKETLGADRVQVFDYVIRKRHEDFPVSTGGFYEWKQPSSIVHVDTTPPQTDELLRTMNPEEFETLSRQHYQYVNIWKPLSGPVRDWPLALCDPNSAQQSDYVARDIVESTSFMETYQFYRNPAHKWYYASKQKADEAWIFLQSDSDDETRTGVPHSSFPNPLSSKNTLPRQSIEVRALVFYNKKD